MNAFSCQTFFWYTANSYKKLQKNSIIYMVKTCTYKLENCIMHTDNRKLPPKLQVKSGLQRIHVIVVEKKYAV